MATFTILGAGMMGSALAVPLVERGHEVRLVGTHLDEAIVGSLRKERFHPTLRMALPEGIQPLSHHELDGALDGADFLALGVSSAGLNWACAELAPRLRHGTPVFMITKGMRFEGGRMRVFVDVVADALPQAQGVAAIGGPCIAGELARRVPTCVVVAGRDRGFLEGLCEILRGSFYFPVLDDDPVGAEVCSALKNAFAMGVAIAAGLHERDGGEPGSVATHNVESAVFAQSVLEMQRVIRRVGGRPDGAAWLSGAGDLDVTNNGGRTGRFGRWLGRGVGLAQAVAN
ncbi:MAG: glycerol-3-phosphate dehydrogenase, partial [Myxococcota bacterium]